VFCGFFIACFVALGFALNKPEPLPIWGFYVLGDLLSTLMVAAFFAYLTDIATPDQAKRLFGVIGGGGVVGGWAGSTLAWTLLKTVGMQGLLFLSAAMMGMIIVVTFWTERLIRRSQAFKPSPRLKPVEKTPAERQSKFGVAMEGACLVLRSKYLAAIVGIMGFYEIASQLGDYQWSRAVERLSGVTGTQEFIANVYFYANLVAVLVQFLLVSLIMKKAGVMAALLVLPVVILCTSLAFLAVPTLYVASLFVISESGLNYSIQQTARESLYVVTTPEEKYKARAFTNMFVQRLAKGLGILAVIGLGMLEVAVRYLSLITLVVVMVMAICSVYAGRTFSQKSEALERGSRAA
jgi:AAA family ATP:ADP antiporter